MRTIGRIAAVLLLVCIPASYSDYLMGIHRPGVSLDYHSLAIVAIRDKREAAAGARVGDVVDRAALSFGDRIRIITAPVMRPFDVPLRRAGRHFSIPLTVIDRQPRPGFIVHFAIVEFVAVVSLGLGAVVLWRRPGPLAFAFGAYGLNSLYALPTSALFEFLPDPAFSVVAVGVNLSVSVLPPLALILFALRFPEPLRSKNGRLVTRFFDAVVVGLALLGVVRTLQAVTIGDLNDPWFDTAPSLFTSAALVAIVTARFAQARGEVRRRLGWVALGTIVASIDSTYLDFGIVGVVGVAPEWVDDLSVALQAGLPFAFAYAILRHRVIDLGFAINRTVVYGATTATLVTAVSFVDWLSGKVIGNTHLSTIVEAVATIALGVALSWFHGRVERGVDRVLFRSRYLAEKRIEGRIAALGFASRTQSIDEALVDEVVAVLQPGSAAVFRRSDTGAFSRAAACGWDAAPHEIGVDHLLVRTLRARERTVDLRADGILVSDFPAGAARPHIAIPIVVRHDFLGFALYGHRADDATLDREDVTLLERLVVAAALAYDAVDAAEWRRRALALEPIRALETGQLRAMPAAAAGLSAEA